MAGNFLRAALVRKKVLNRRCTETVCRNSQKRTHAQQPAAGGPIRIGQIGTKHAHASGKMSAIRSLGELFEVVGVVEPDDAQRNRVADSKSYRDLRWMTQDELLATPGLAAVAVETPVRDLVHTAMACVRAGKHVHLDKPAGPSEGAKAVKPAPSPSGLKAALDAALAKVRGQGRGGGDGV